MNFILDPFVPEAQLLIDLNKECFPTDPIPDWNSALWYGGIIIGENTDVDGEVVSFCGWKPIIQNSSIRGFHYRAGVSERARGRGLQKKMIAFREKEMRSHSINTAVTYTDADNANSMRNLIEMGYRPYCPDHYTCLSGFGRLGRVGFVHWIKDLRD